MDDRRCAARDHEGHRCQLFTRHDGHDHAALIFTGPWVYSRGTGKVRPRKVIRWGNDGREWVDPGDEWGAAATGRPAWCAMGLD
jgi:hypothetical protein